MIAGCAKWILAGAGLELLSALGFVVFFKLVFAAPLSWRRTTPAALRALGASTILWRALTKPTTAVSASITDARAVVTTGDWKLVGAGRRKQEPLLRTVAVHF